MPHRLGGRARLLPTRRSAADGSPSDAQRIEQVTLQPTIRPATPADLSFIEALYVELKQHHHDLVPASRRYNVSDERWIESIRTSLSDPNTHFLVADLDEEVVGFMRLRFEEKTWGKGCEVDTIVVTDRLRGREIGHRLMREAERFARDCGATGLRVNVAAANERGLSFYVALGFELLALRYGKDLD